MDYQQNNNNNDNSIWNKVLYKDMKGKDVTLGKFIIGIILLVGGIYLSIKAWI